MFGILALKEFRFACLDDGNDILYFQGHGDAFVYCIENIMHYQAQKKTNCLEDRFMKAVSHRKAHIRDTSMPESHRWLI